MRAPWLPQRWWDEWRRHPEKVRVYRTSIAIVTFAYIAIGLGLIIQPHRFENTPSYANLLAMLPQDIWGIIYIIIGAGLSTSVILDPGRVRAVLTHTAAIILTSIWLAAFIIRYATDSGTTIVNCCSWAVFLILIIRSARHLPDET